MYLFIYRIASFIQLVCIWCTCNTQLKYTNHVMRRWKLDTFKIKIWRFWNIIMTLYYVTTYAWWLTGPNHQCQDKTSTQWFCYYKQNCLLCLHSLVTTKIFPVTKQNVMQMSTLVEFEDGDAYKLRLLKKSPSWIVVASWLTGDDSCDFIRCYVNTSSVFLWLDISVWSCRSLPHFAIAVALAFLRARINKHVFLQDGTHAHSPPLRL